MTVPTQATDRTLQRVVVEMASGVQTSIDPDTAVVGPDGPLAPTDVPAALSDPDGWIEYASSVRWEDEDAPPLEAWQTERIEWNASTRRIYARGVTEASLIWEGE